MAKIGVEKDALNWLARDIQEAGGTLEDLKEAFKKAAADVAADAKTRSPERSGAMLKTIRSSGTRRAGVIRAGGKAHPYAGPIHFGWPARNIKAQPFILSAAREGEARWLKHFIKTVNKTLDKIKDRY